MTTSEPVHEPALRFTISALEPAELNMLYKSWHKSYREAFPNMKTDDFHAMQATIIDEILSRFPLLLCARNPDGVALGWLCAEASDTALTIHYTNVKGPYRRQGVCKALLAAAIDALPDAGPANVYTHRTRRSHLFDSLGFTYQPIGRFLRESV